LQIGLHHGIDPMRMLLRVFVGFS
jgi:hypothetical protein